MDAADSNLPSDLGALGIGEVDHLDVVAAVDPRLRAVGLDEVRDVARAAAVAGQTERQDRAHGGRGRVRDADHVHDRAEVLRLAVVDDEQRVPAQVDVLVLEVGQRESADELRRIGLRDVEHGDAAPAAHVGVVVLEVHPGGGSRDVRQEWTLLEVARGGSSRAARSRHRVQDCDDGGQASSATTLPIRRPRLRMSLPFASRAPCRKPVELRYPCRAILAPAAAGGQRGASGSRSGPPAGRGPGPRPGSASSRAGSRRRR